MPVGCWGTATILDGLGQYYRQEITESGEEPVDVAAELRAREVQVVVGAAGLGTMLAIRSGGGVLGLLLLALVGAEGRAGQLFVAGAATFGLMLLLFAQTPGFHEALVLLAAYDESGAEVSYASLCETAAKLRWRMAHGPYQEAPRSKFSATQIGALGTLQGALRR